MVTAFASDDTSQEAMEKGAFAYLSKPFNPTQLMERVDRALAPDA
jgi:DNA-binding NtrC family response regulator